MGELKKLLKCGWCGCFCDNNGDKFEATKQLIGAVLAVRFLDALGECSDCKPRLNEEPA